jgi:uncharacterized membrane protein
MPDRLNPYAAPATELRTESGEHCWRDGKVVVLRAGHDFPARCICCNAPATPPRKGRSLSWHSPWLFLLLLLNILVYLVVALLARRRVKLHPALCTVHAAARRRGLWTGVGILLLGLLVLFSGTAAYGNDPYGLSGPLVLGGSLLLLVALWIASRVPASLSAARIDRREVRVRGAGEPFLASLPPFVGLPPTGS